MTANPLTQSVRDYRKIPSVASRLAQNRAFKDGQCLAVCYACRKCECRCRPSKKDMVVGRHNLSPQPNDDFEPDRTHMVATRDW